MRKTLRRSCNACAKSKLSCDLRTPQCSRCSKRKSACLYANEPLTSPFIEEAGSTDLGASRTQKSVSQLPNDPVPLLRIVGTSSFDPFESYPPTRLPMASVQRLIQHFLSSIAFQYYPLDPSPLSNPFIVSWWPQALADPALFHVSLQTASLDVELRAQRGFAISEVLMADSVSLVRQNIENPTLASQDETLDAVITLAAIEVGKGNMALGKMHVDGVKSMVRMRGGLQRVKFTSPLTARMVAWVTMILMGSPQFPARDQGDDDDGIPPISQWHGAAMQQHTHGSLLDAIDINHEVGDIIIRLRNLLHGSQRIALSNTDLHDLTCYVLHRLLTQSPQSINQDGLEEPPITGCMRHGMILYMLIIHGPTYFSHAKLQFSTTQHLKTSLAGPLTDFLPSHESVVVWALSVGMVASDCTPECPWFMTRAKTVAESLRLSTWEDTRLRLQKILWLELPQLEVLFRQHWEAVYSITTG